MVGAVRLVLDEGKTIGAVARELDLTPSALGNWVRQARADRSQGKTKAKLTTRKAYGFRSYRCLEIALYHTLGQLPESETTHRFC